MSAMMLSEGLAGRRGVGGGAGRSMSVLVAVGCAAVLNACSVPEIIFTPDNLGASDAGALDGRESDAALSGPTMATITVTRSGATGMVSAPGLSISCGEECTATVAVGTAVTLVAMPGLGSVFGGWTGDGCSGSASTCTMTVTTDVAIAARFDVARFTVDLQLIGSGAGLVTSNGPLMCPGMCGGVFDYGATIELTATPTGSASFTGWAGPCSGTNLCSFTVTADTLVTVGFATNDELIVTRAGNGGGTVSSVPSGILCPTDCTERYPPGTPVTLSASASADSVFGGWSGEGCMDTGTCRVTIDRARMVTATFTLRKHDLQVVRAGAGAGLVVSDVAGISCGLDCSESYDAHTQVNLTASADVRSTFVSWSGVVGCASNSTCTVTMETATTATATFALRQFTLSVNRTGGGSGSVSSSPAGISCGTACTAAFDIDTLVVLTPSAAAGSAFTEWSGACTGFGPCQVLMTQSDLVTARFEPRQPSGLFLINQNTARLERLDPATLVGADVGPLNVPYSVGDCAYIPANDTLYMVDGLIAARKLYKLNRVTGAATEVGVHGVINLLALAFHPPSNQFYGVARQPGENLYRINPLNGAAELVGPTNTAFIEGLAWDSQRNRMTALSSSTDTFYSINLDTAAATTLQASPGLGQLGMSYDAVRDRFWVADTTGSIFQFDPNNNFARTTVTTFSNGHTCVALVP